MKTAKIAELKNRLSRYLEYVRAGGTVLVLDRNVPVARIVPLDDSRASTANSDARLKRHEARGLIARGRGSVAGWLARHKPLRVTGGLLKAVLEERESGW